MRRTSVLFLAVGLLAATAPMAAHAQIGGGGGGRPGGGGGGGGDDDGKKRRLDKEMQTQALPLPPVNADGPCPFVKVLYDAGRMVDFKDPQRPAASNVAWSGEIEGLLSDCQYHNDDPIKVSVNTTFRFGRGPMADGQRKTFSYWVAVTDRNRAILAKEYFTADVTFQPGQDRVTLIDKVEQIEIPRKSKTVSGENFEVLVGFDVTPQQAAFNRNGSRFRVNASGDPATATTAPAAAR